MDSHSVEIVRPWKHEIKRLVDLLLATEDLRTVQSLTIEGSNPMHPHIEELHRQLMLPDRSSDDCPVVEINGSDPSSQLFLPKPAEQPLASD